jgi:hypothetical protein
MIAFACFRLSLKLVGFFYQKLTLLFLAHYKIHLILCLAQAFMQLLSAQTLLATLFFPFLRFAQRFQLTLTI